VRRIPRIALLLFCVAYVIPGFLGREAWKNADMAAFGFMSQLADGTANWLSPTLLGMAPEQPALLPYWLGALAIQIAPSWMGADFAVRIPFALLLALALTATWYGTYYLARSPEAQPVPFAFGGEAQPTDYARAIADGGLLAFIASLGLAQLSHETTPALAQLSFSALLFFAVAAMPYRRAGATLTGLVAIVGLALSGAPVLALIFGIGASALLALHAVQHQTKAEHPCAERWQVTSLALGALLIGYLSFPLHVWQWKVVALPIAWSTWRGIGELLLWFTWPAGAVALWTLWRWRKQLFTSQIHVHVALPTWFVTVGVLASIATGASDRTLLLALPACAALAAFALPTLKRQMGSLIDWFTLLFFSTCGLTIWVVWIAMQTGFPPQPAANVARLAPGFQSQFSGIALATAVLATLAWGWLVKWRVGRHRQAVWKSLVLPGCGAALCWLLLMTLWMPLLNYSQSYGALVHAARLKLNPDECVQTQFLDQGLAASLVVYGKLDLREVNTSPNCPWLLSQPDLPANSGMAIDAARWELVDTVRHPADGNEAIAVYRARP